MKLYDVIADWFCKMFTQDEAIIVTAAAICLFIVLTTVMRRW